MKLWCKATVSHIFIGKQVIDIFFYNVRKYLNELE